MNILLSTCSFAFSSNINGANNEETVRNTFSKEFPNITVVNTPTNAPVEIPRFILLSHHGFTTIVITSNLLQLTTRFNDEYSSDWNNRCKPYLESKIQLVYDFFASIGMKVKYSGITVNSIIQTDNDSVKLIEEKFLKQKAISDLQLYDVMQKQSFGYKDKFFINLQIQNQRYPAIEQNGINPVFNQKESSKTVSVVVDINDRQISNKDENYCSSRESFHEILTINEKIISFGLRNIIEGDKVLCLN